MRAANRHGQVQALLLILGLVVVGVVVVVDEASPSTTSLSDRLLPFELPVLGLVVAWGLVLAVLLRRHAGAIRTDPAARRVFRDAALFLTVHPVLPGILLWGQLGWVASAIGLCCVIAVFTVLRPGR